MPPIDGEMGPGAGAKVPGSSYSENNFYIFWEMEKSLFDMGFYHVWDVILIWKNPRNLMVPISWLKNASKPEVPIGTPSSCGQKIF